MTKMLTYCGMGFQTYQITKAIYWEHKAGQHFRATHNKDFLTEKEQTDRQQVDEYMKNHCNNFLLKKKMDTSFRNK